MQADLRERFALLLRDLPEWEKEEDRRALLRGILYDLPVWDLLNFKGSAAVAADELIGVCEKSSPETPCLLLTGLREKYKTHTRRRQEIEFLTGRLCAGTARKRRQWKGPPYPGLTYFDRDQAPIFFGRDSVLNELVRTLMTEQGQRFTVILGASGSGKSSLVRAGLWAKLEEGQLGEIPGSANWLISVMTPTDLDDPMTSLRASVLNALRQHPSFQSQADWKKELAGMRQCALSEMAEGLLQKAPPEARWLVILDQMEELFAGGNQASRRRIPGPLDCGHARVVAHAGGGDAARGLSSITVWSIRR